MGVQPGRAMIALVIAALLVTGAPPRAVAADPAASTGPVPTSPADPMVTPPPVEATPEPEAEAPTPAPVIAPAPEPASDPIVDPTIDPPVDPVAPPAPEPSEAAPPEEPATLEPSPAPEPAPTLEAAPDGMAPSAGPDAARSVGVAAAVTSMTVSGTVTGPGGDPVEGIDVTAWYGWGWPEELAGSISTAADGTWSMTLAPSGDAGLQFEFNDPNDLYPHGWYSEGTGFTAFLTSATTVWFTTSTVTGLDAELPASLPTISGRVTAAGDVPVASAGVDVYLAGDWVAGTTADDQGNWSATVQPGTYTVHVSGGIDYRAGWYSDSGFTPYADQATPVTVPAEGATGIDVILPPGIYIEGTITNAAGDPLEGIWISAWTEVDSSYAESAADGTYRLPVTPGSWIMRASDSSSTYLRGYWSATGFVLREEDATAIAIADAGRTGVNLVLPSALHIAGRVTESDQSPVPDVWVSASLADGSWSVGVVTAVDGTYSLAVPAGSFRLAFYDENEQHVPGYWSDGGFVYDFADATLVMVVDADVSGIDLAYPEPITISGTVRDARGAGLESIRVWAENPDTGDAFSGSTDADGNYAALAYPGSWMVRFQDNSGVHPSGYWTAAGYTFDADSAGLVVVGDTSRNGIDVVLPDALHISGTITDADGVPIMDQGLEAGSNGGGWASAQSAADGTYSLSVVPGTYRIYVYGNGTHPSGWYRAGGLVANWDLADPVVVTDADVLIDITVPATLFISGTVTNTDGDPVAGLYVNVSARGGSKGTQPGPNSAVVRGDSAKTVVAAAGATTTAGVDTTGKGVAVETAADGTYSFGVLPGTYYVSVYDPTNVYLEAWYPSDVVVTDADVPGIDITVTKGSHISGTVTGPGGTPASGIYVSAVDKWGDGYGDAATDANGAYSIMLPPGTYFIQFETNETYLGGWYTPSGPVAAEADASPVVLGTADVDGIDIELPLALHITGTVTRAGGGSVGDVYLRAVRPDGTLAYTAYPAQDGSYALSVGPGTYTVRVRDYTDGTSYTGWYTSSGFTFDGDAATPVAVTAADVPGIDIVLPALYHITGTVTDTSGSPLPDIEVEADGPAWASTNTAADGTFSVTVPAGTYDLWVNDYDDLYWSASLSGVVVTDSDVAGLVIQMEKATLVTGHVQGESAVPVADMRVTAYDTDGNYVMSGWTDAAGNYRIPIRAGAYSIRFRGDDTWAPGWYSSTGYVASKAAATPIVVGSDDVPNINVTLPHALHITGTITGAGAGPLQDASVEAADADGFGAYAWTDQAGQYSLSVAPGTYWVRVSPEGVRHAAGYYSTGGWVADQASATPVTVTTTDMPGISLELPATHAISGTVETGSVPPWDISLQAVNAAGDVVASAGPDEASGYSIWVLDGDYALRVMDWTGTYAGGYWTPMGLVATLAEAALIHVAGASVSGYDIDLTATPDTTPPTAELTAPSSPTKAAGLSYGVTFSESVTGLGAGDFALSGTATGCAVGTVAGSGSSYTVAVTGCGDGTVILKLHAGSVADLAGNHGPAADVAASTVTVDRTAPAVSITRVNGTAVTFPHTTTTEIDSVGGTCGTAAGDSGTLAVTLDGSAAAPASTTCTSGTWTLTFATPVASLGAHTVGASQSDSLGNTGTAASVSITRNPPVSSDANLASLTLAGVAMSPSFTAGTTAYTASVANAVASTTLTATSANAWATITWRRTGGSFASIGSGVTSGAIALDEGATTIEVKVAASDGVTTKTYSMVITRTAGETVPVAPGGPSTVTVTDPVLGSSTVGVGSAGASASVTIEQTTNPASSTPFAVSGSTVFVDITAPGTSGPYTVCLPGASPARIWHFAAGTWTDITSAPPADYVGGRVCGTSATLSPFAVGVALDTTPPAVSAPSVTLRAGATLSGSAVPVAVAWSGSDAGSGVASYELVRSTDGGVTWSSALASGTATTWSGTAASSGTVMYRVRATDTAGNTSAWSTGPRLTPRLVQQTSKSITWKGSWSSARASGYSGGSEKWSKARGASATYKVTGRSVALVVTRGKARGKAKVYLDGRLVKTVDLLRSSTQYRYVAWQATWAKAGTHTIKVVVSGTSGRPRVDLDALVTVK